MELIKPLCGNNRNAHELHWGSAADQICPGWSQASADACNLARLLIVTAGRAYLDYRGDPDVPMVTLTCHPSVEHSLMQVMIPGYREFVAGDLKLLPPEIRVEVTTELPEGGWRLTLACGSISSDTSIPQTDNAKEGMS